MKRILSPAGVFITLVLTGVAADRVPRPEEVFGFRPGDDYKLADYSQMTEYYRRLDQASDRIQVIDIGPSAEGRRMMLAIISSEANLADLEKHRQTSEKLARARIRPEEARQLAAQGKAIVWIDGGLHATEVAHAQHSPELAYRVVTEESEEMRFIRDHVILLQVPVMNPDGLEIVVNWYKRNLGTEFETSPLPELYHKYVGHDNNRDFYMMTQPESRNVAELLYQQWYPQIVYNHHQTAPFPARIFIPPFAPPFNPNIPPLVLRGVDLVGSAMSARFEKEGKPGVVSRLVYSTWWNGGMRTAPYFHNMIGILTETALYRYATPYEYKQEKLPQRFRNGMPTLKPSADYPNPWKGGWWRLRDAIEYMLTASLAVLDAGARYRDQWLYNIYLMGRESISNGETESPYAYLVPPHQHDPSGAVMLVETLRRGGVEIHQAAAPLRLEGKEFPAGTYVIYTAQPFRPYLLDLMEPQNYPDRRLYPGGPPERPYDMAGWTLPVQMGVQVTAAAKRFDARVLPLTQVELPDPPPPPEADSYVVDRRWNAAYRLVNDLLGRKVTVKVSPAEIFHNQQAFPAGSFIIQSADLRLLRELSQKHRVPLHPLEGEIQGRHYQLRSPRLGLYKSWVANMDEGWTRWLLEQYGFSYENIFDRDIRAGGLRDRFDVIVLPSQGARSLMRGHAPGSMPPEFTGGLGLEGFAELKRFVEEAGVLVALDAASEVPVQYFNLPLRNVLDGVPSSSFYCPGSLLRLKVNPADPVGFGMSAESAAFFVNSRAFQIGYLAGEPGEEEEEKASASEWASVVEYADKDVLISGWILGEDRVQGKSAVIRGNLGKGKVVVLGFRSQFRGQPHGTFKLLFNSILLGGMN